MIPPLAGGRDSEHEVDSSTSKPDERRTSTGIQAENILDLPRERATSNFDEVVG
jgi:hypothetical protein